MTTERLLARPIFGGIFGQGRYALASMPCVSRGLHATKYMVVEPRGGAVLSVADDKVEALAGARRVLHAVTELEQFEGNAPPAQGQLWPVLPAPDVPPAAPRVSRRRREVFERCQGRCHYCQCGLQIEAFEIEHMFPRALGGGDDPLNLVAACSSCNRRKSDRTALEFIAEGNT